ncbi:MAG: hypothetical protein JNN30_10790 [Rhodanobacteraceae bacterium]|nr:hypothetical protein [Rhodanobacteraceae bacterium]
MLSSVITCFVDLLEGAGVATDTGGIAAVVARSGAFGAVVFATTGGIVGVSCFIFAEAVAGKGADFGLLGAAAAVLPFVVFNAAFAAGLDAAPATGLATGLAAGFGADFAAFSTGFTAFAVFAAGLAFFLAGAPAFAATFLGVVADTFFTALALAVPLPLATTFFAVICLLFAISVHRCG